MSRKSYAQNTKSTHVTSDLTLKETTFFKSIFFKVSTSLHANYWGKLRYYNEVKVRR